MKKEFDRDRDRGWFVPFVIFVAFVWLTVAVMGDGSTASRILSWFAVIMFILHSRIAIKYSC